MNQNDLTALFQTLLPFVISPGASFSLTVSASIARVPNAALHVWAGTALGIVALALVSALGVAPLILAYPMLQRALALVGGLLLMVWGVRLCQAPAPKQATALPARLGKSAFVVLIGNIKAITLYAVVLPALAAAKHAPLVFYPAAVAVHSVMLLCWLMFVAALVRRLPHTQGLQRFLRYTAAGFMVYLGGKSVLAALALIHP